MNATDYLIAVSLAVGIALVAAGLMRLGAA